MEFRHEWKHRINAMDLICLRSRLSVVMRPDENAVNGKYTIRSVYFDTPQDTALREKLDGVDRREKFRLRCYNGNASLIHLEKKSKICGLCRKEVETLGLTEADRLLRGDLDWMGNSTRPLLRELYQMMATTRLRPKTIVDYTREPYVYGPGNVRVTLDYDIRTGLGCTDFLDPHCVTIPATDAIILEVKWDDFLPDLIRRVVQLDSCRTEAFSKYAVCRIYD